MTQDQLVALAHWSRFGAAGFPIVKRGHKWWVSVAETSIWRVVTAGYPLPFKTKGAAETWFDNIVLQRSREWRDSGLSNLLLDLAQRPLTVDEWKGGMGCVQHRAQRSGSCHDCAMLQPAEYAPQAEQGGSRELEV